MSDDFEPDRLFENMRDNLRRAPVAPAAEVRRRGHQRQVRARVLTATTAVVLVTGGAGVAFAATHDTDSRTVTPATTTTSTSTPTASPTPTATATPTTPAPSTPPAAVAPTSQSQSQSQSSVTTRTTPPAAATTTHTRTTSHPTTTTPGAPLSSSPPEYITVTVTATPGKGQFTWQTTATGRVAQTYDSSTHRRSPGLNQFGSGSVELDGAVIDGGDAGNVDCPIGSPVVPSAVTLKSRAPVIVKPGVHQLTFTIRSCDGVIGSRTITFTVR